MKPKAVEDARAWSVGLLEEMGFEANNPSVFPAQQIELAKVPEGGRNTCLTSLAGSLRSKGLGANTIREMLLVANQRICDPPLEDVEVEAIAHSIGKRPLSITTSSLYKRSEVVKFVSLGELKEPGPRIEIVEGIVPEGHPTILYGHGGQGKSLLALALGMCVAMGRPFLERTVIAGNVLYLDWELDEEEHARRAYQIIRGFGMSSPPKNLWYGKAAASLPDLMPILRETVEKRDAKLIILDSLGPACGSDPESAKNVIPIMNNLRDLGVASLVIDHQAKQQSKEEYGNKTPFGSVYKFNAARSVLQMEAKESSDGLLIAGLSHTKHNFGPKARVTGIKILFSELEVQFHSVDPESHSAFAKGMGTKDRVLESLLQDGQATKQELAERLSMNPPTMGNILSTLKSEGAVEVVDKKGRQVIYELAQKGDVPDSNSNDDS